VCRLQAVGGRIIPVGLGLEHIGEHRDSKRPARSNTQDAELRMARYPFFVALTRPIEKIITVFSFVRRAVTDRGRTESALEKFIPLH